MGRGCRYVGMEVGRKTWVWDAKPWDMVFAVIVGENAHAVIADHPEVLDEIKEDAEFMDGVTPEFVSLLARAGDL